MADVTAPIRVLIIDDHVLYRRGLELVIGQEDDLLVVGEDGDGAGAAALVEQTHPDVVLLDVRMPRYSGIDACRDIKRAHPNIWVVMLTTSDDEQDLFSAVRAGANGYILKDSPADDVIDGIRSVVTGRSLVPPSLAGALLAEFAAMSSRQEAPAAVNLRLTDRELQVLRLIARGMANRDIARELFISENTVKNHVRSILEKLGLRSRMEAAMYAVREGLTGGEATGM